VRLSARLCVEADAGGQLSAFAAAMGRTVAARHHSTVLIYIERNLRRKYQACANPDTHTGWERGQRT
jgi:hypothetical protein